MSYLYFYYQTLQLKRHAVLGYIFIKLKCSFLIYIQNEIKNKLYLSKPNIDYYLIVITGCFRVPVTFIVQAPIGYGIVILPISSVKLPDFSYLYYNAITRQFRTGFTFSTFYINLNRHLLFYSFCL